MRPLLALLIRTLREHCRARSTYLVRGFIALLLLLILWITHEAESWMGAPGKRFFTLLIILNYVCATLAGVGICAAAIAEEKEEGTLGLLRMADLNPLSILLGKSTGRLGLLLLFLSVQVPFALLAVTLGGISARQILTCFALVGSYLFVLANVALFFSVLCSRVWRATLLTAISLVGVFILPTALTNIAGAHSLRWLGSNLLRRIAEISMWLDTVNPWNHLLRAAQSAYPTMEVTRSVMVHLGCGAAAFFFAWLIFDRRADNEAAFDSTPRRLSFRRMRILRPPRPRAHAVAWKDFHFTFGGRFMAVARFVAYLIVIVFSLWLGDWNLWRRNIADITWNSGLVFFHVEATILTLRMWAPERWQLNLSSLVLTPLSLRRLNAEKAKAFLIGLLPSLAVLVGALVIGGSSFVERFFQAPYSATSPGMVVYVMQMIAQRMGGFIFLLYFLSLCLNLSLRLKWTALPAALCVLVFTQVFLSLGLMFFMSVAFFRSIVPSMGWFAFVQFFQLLIVAVLAALLFFDTQRQLLRLSSEG